MIIFSIETSCDETSISILKDRFVLYEETISQKEHKNFGGVVPGLAADLHVEKIYKVFKKVLKKEGNEFDKIDYVAYTKGPGLVICLQVGEMMAKTLGLYLKKKVIGIDHLEGHIYSSLINNKEDWVFPMISLIISGGHTQLRLLEDHNTSYVIGDTKDDTIGECLDKASVLFGFGYPGGPIIEKLAVNGRNNYKFSFPKNDKSCDFSFSGLKAEISRLVEKEKKSLNLNDAAFSLQKRLSEILVKKIKNAFFLCKNIKSFSVGGGVIANNFFRDRINKCILEIDKGIKVFFPEIKYSTDNACMIGVRAFFLIKNRDV